MQWPRNENFVRTSKNLVKSRNWILPIVCYPTRKPEPAPTTPRTTAANINPQNQQNKKKGPNPGGNNPPESRMHSPESQHGQPPTPPGSKITEHPLTTKIPLRSQETITSPQPYMHICLPPTKKRNCGSFALQLYMIP